MGGVTALAWTMTGLLATALAILAAALFQSQSRTDSLRAEIVTRTDSLRADIGADLREIRDAVRSLDRRLTPAGG